MYKKTNTVKIQIKLLKLAKLEIKLWKLWKNEKNLILLVKNALENNARFVFGFDNLAFTDSLPNLERICETFIQNFTAKLKISVKITH